MVPTATTDMPLMKAVSAVQVRTLHTMKQCDALLALGTKPHLDPSAAMVLAPSSVVKPVEATLTEEVLALVTEENCILGRIAIALHAHLHLLHLSRLLFLCGPELCHDVAVAPHQLPEVLDILYLPFFPHRVAVMPQSAPQDMDKVRLTLNVHPKNPSHFYYIFNGLDKRIVT